ncbi:hypothetical protein BHECKSOX2_542 [Bathymodiolus heckerae thiotrophic gill symbiont]|uniref:transposase n=1 Tax=Bathymodiolus heckerae thiotrophic gill symbiont TaxID=1052212 RepID=UPI0010B21731|nr:transposase [Bathymodiolus heckerae thiotrophic gill symbiont]CAC9434910.1 hypothetical protein [uncultured Gammaproteobacteria bacterium]SMN13479.1 hypothetical protein BHECKSOX2_542 [Bathymodiolus heckerae thiotrophic gill symbiont]SMN14990.1 hypothetical protein CRYPD_266 [uncultured Candidatus Thioglobus sp.]
MPRRDIEFVTNEYYHVFNRGIDKRDIFMDKNDLYFFFKRLNDLNRVNHSDAYKHSRNRKDVEINEDKLVEIVAYCLLPNHFHLLLKQKNDKGISKFMHRLGASYVNFFNKKYKRAGGLFQSRFKAKHLSGEYALPIVASYVNLNYKHHHINPKENLVKSSVFEYFGNELGDRICSADEINGVIAEIGSLDDYQDFAKNASQVFIDNKKSQHLLLLD